MALPAAWLPASCARFLDVPARATSIIVSVGRWPAMGYIIDVINKDMNYLLL
jgi:hypothetical protein